MLGVLDFIGRFAGSHGFHWKVCWESWISLKGLLGVMDWKFPSGVMDLKVCLVVKNLRAFWGSWIESFTGGQRFEGLLGGSQMGCFPRGSCIESFAGGSWNPDMD